MPRKRQEMIEVDQNEYIFGENGGRGMPASTFFRRIANMAPNGSRPPSPFSEAASEGQQLTVGAGRSHAEHLTTIPTSAGSHSSKKARAKKKVHSSGDERKRSATPTNAPSARHNSVASANSSDATSYFDLDDDWDANFDSVTSRHIPRSLSRATFGLQDSSEQKEPSEVAAKAECDELNSQVSRIIRFQTVLNSPTVDMEQLQRLAWSGVPSDLRPRTWMQLLGYLPPTAERRAKTLQKKRGEYVEALRQAFETSAGLDQAMWHQISIDVPRTNPHIKMYSYEATQRSLERILYLWAIRHPASGYVQGINDLVTPFFQTFLTEYVGTRRVEELDPGTLQAEQLGCVEADSYWCLSKLLDGIQDSYIHAQPGIHRQVAHLERLVTKIDADLVSHFKREGVEFMQFSFRWMNCLLMREVPMNCAIRIWDTYLSEGPQGFSGFHVYVCAAFLIKWTKQLKEMEFQDLMIFLQALPTKDWTEKDIELVLSQAFMYQALFKDALK